MNVLHDMFPNFYDLSKEINENPEILRDKNASVLSHTKFHQGCSVVSVRMWGVCLLDLLCRMIVWRGSGEIEYFTYFDSVFKLFFISMQCFGSMETGSLVCRLKHWIDFCVIVPLEWYVWSEFLIFPFFQSSIDIKHDTGSK